MPSFEQNIEALEAVVERLERGELGLEESVKLFEQGMTLSRDCKAELASAEGRIQLLTQSPGIPDLRAVPFEASGEGDDDLPLADDEDDDDQDA